MPPPSRPSGNRFVDDGRTLYDFTHEIVVVCPRCEREAVVVPMPYGDDQFATSPPWIEPRRLICPSCGLARDQRDRHAAFGECVDPYFQLPLWLQAPAAGHLVWAYNSEHIDYLRRFVAAGQRGRPARPGQPRSVAERLPEWFKVARHRAEISRALEELAERAKARPPAGGTSGRAF